MNVKDLNFAIDLNEAQAWATEVLQVKTSLFRWLYDPIPYIDSTSTFQPIFYNLQYNTTKNDFKEACGRYIDRNPKNYARTNFAFGWGEVILNTFSAACNAILTVLPPQGQVIEHIDGKPIAKENLHMIHIPIFSNDKAFSYVNGEKVFMQPGKVYYLNTSVPHSAKNFGNTDRVHLMFGVDNSVMQCYLQR